MRKILLAELFCMLAITVQAQFVTIMGETETVVNDTVSTDFNPTDQYDFDEEDDDEEEHLLPVLSRIPEDTGGCGKVFGKVKRIFKGKKVKKEKGAVRNCGKKLGDKKAELWEKQKSPDYFRNRGF